MSTETKPGDLVGTDGTTGRLRIDRVVPLPWILGALVGLAGYAVNQHYTQRQMLEQLTALRAEVTESAAERRALTLRDVEQALKLIEHERRIGALEGKR